MTNETQVNAKPNVAATATAAAALGVLFMGSTIPTPLYPTYQKAFDFSGLTLTLIYAVYVLGNVGVLLLFGGLADRIGRRRTILPSIALAMSSTVAFAVATGIAWLFLGRFLSGLATGLVAGAATSWITAGLGDSDAGARQKRSRISWDLQSDQFSGELLHSRRPLRF